MKNITLLFVLCANICFSQTHRFIYEFKYKSDSNSADYDKINMTLDINPTQVKFYPYKYAEKDSLNKVRNTHNAGWDNKFPVIIRNKNSFENTNYTFMDALLSYKTSDKMSWKLLPETKTVDGYNLQKATTNFGGRKWTAWFSKDINLNEGPYKFRGLPGLIFEIMDNSQNFSFSLLKSWKLKETYPTSDFIENFAGQKAVATTEKLVQKKQLDYFNDPLQSIREKFEPNKTELTVYGVKVTNKEQFKDLTKITQDALRKQYNPIEIDKAVKYPKN